MIRAELFLDKLIKEVDTASLLLNEKSIKKEIAK